MSSPASRWRRATRKSSGPFFPGAWPNNSAQDSIIARSVLHATKDAVDTGGGRTTQHGQAGSVAAATTSRLNDVRSPEPLQHLDHVMDFHQRLSLSLDHAQAGSTATEGDLQMHSSRTETFSGSSATTIATPSPLSPTVSMSFPSIFHSDEQHEKPFSLPHITTQHHKSSTLIHSESPAENYYNDTRISTQLDPPLSNFAQGLPPLSLPPHTLSFSPESVASYFSSSEQSRSPLDYTTSPPPRSSSISSSASATPASLTVSSPLQPEIMTLPEIPSSLGFATSFYPVIDSVDSRYGTHPQDIHGLLSPVPTNPMRGYDNDSPVLPAEEETGPSFLSPLLSPRHRGFSPSSADMDAFGLAAIQISSDARSDVSIPTSFRSHFAAGPASREAGSAEADATKPADVYRRHRSSSPSFSSSLSSVGTLSLDQRHPDFHPNLQLRRQESRSEPPLSLLDGRTGLPLETTLTSSAASVRAPVPTRFSKVKQFSGKIKKLFAFKGRSTETGAPAIGVTRSTQVTCVEYASEHPMQPSEARPTITEAASSPQRASVTNRRQSLPVISGAGLSVSKPTARRPVSFLCVDSAVSSSHDLLSPGKLADLQHALGSRLGSKSSVRVSHSRASIGVEKQESSSPAGGNCKGKSVRTSLVATPATPARSHRRSVITTPNTSTPTSPKNSRRFSFSPGLGHSKIDLLRTAMTPRPPLPQTPREAPHLPESVGRSKDFTAVSPNAVADITHKRKAIGSSRMVKARSMVVEHVHHRKPVPSLDDVGPQRPTRTRSTTGDTKVNTAGPSRLSGLKPPGKVFFGEGREGLSPPFLTEPPVLHRALPITERSLDQHSKKRSRGFSFTSTISKRAQKARSVIVGRSEHHVAQPELHIRRALDRQETVETRGSSLGCADYEPDLVPEAMSFAPRSRTLKSAVSEDQLTADQDILERKEVHSMNSSDLIASPDAAEDFPDPVDLL